MKNTRKFLAIVMVIAMIMSMGVLNAFAATTDLTINTTDGHTYIVYQLLKGDVTNLNNGSGTLSNTKVGDDAVASATVASIEAAIKDKSDAELGDVAYDLINKDSTTAQTVVGDGNDQSITVENGYYVVVDTWTGAASEKDTLSRYLVAVVGPTTMEPKATSVELDKIIIDTDNNKADDTYKKTNTAAIGDVINFEITSKVPNTAGYEYFYYVANDTMSKGLTLDTNSFVVKIGDTPLAKDTDYYVYVTVNEDGTTSFQLALNDLKLLVDTANNGISVGSPISIKYNAEVNDDAEIGKIPNTNKVYPIFSNNPGDSTRNNKKDDNGNPIPGIPSDGTATGVGPTKTTKTYVTELTIQKFDNNNMVLTGAEFTLTGENLNKVIITTATEFREAEENETAEYYELINGTYTTEAPKATTYKERGDVTELTQLYELVDGEYVLTEDTELNDAKTYYVVDVLTNANLYKNTTPTHVRVTSLNASTEAGTSNTVCCMVDDAGLITFTGLDAGEYTLSETKTPKGFNTMADINFTISVEVSGASEVEGGSITWSSNNPNIKVDNTNGVFDATIVNVPGSNLPTTGSIGTTIFYVAGGLMVVAAVIFLVTKKRMHNAAN